MARTYGKALCTLWLDGDFLALSDTAKVLFLAFISQPDITPAGVLPLTERRWARWVHDDPIAALTELEENRFVVVDQDTAEVWVRSFIRHDGRLENHNLAESVRRSAVDIRSTTIRGRLDATYPHLHDKPPGRRPFEGRSKAVQRAYRTASEGHPQPLDLDQDPDPHPHPSSVDISQGADDDTKKKTEEIIDAIVAYRADGREDIANRDSWRRAVRANVAVEHTDRIRRLVDQFPNAPAAVIAGAVETNDARTLNCYQETPT